MEGYVEFSMVFFRHFYEAGRSLCLLFSSNSNKILFLNLKYNLFNTYLINYSHIHGILLELWHIASQKPSDCLDGNKTGTRKEVFGESKTVVSNLFWAMPHLSG